jgi:hypothetical protein
MRGEIARNFAAGSGADLPHCPPGQVPDATALPAVGQALSDATPIYSCVALPPPSPEADLAPTQGATSKAGALLSDNAKAGVSLDAVSRTGASLNGTASKAGAPLATAASPPLGTPALK